MAAITPDGSLARYHLAAAGLAVDHAHQHLQNALLSFIQAVCTEATTAETPVTPSRRIRARLELLRQGELAVEVSRDSAQAERIAA